MSYHQIESRIAKARRQIVTGKPNDALPLLEDIANSLAKIALEPAQAKQLRVWFEELHMLAGAALEGVAKARADISAILKEAESSLTYDRQGRLSRVSAGPASDLRRV